MESSVVKQSLESKEVIGIDESEDIEDIKKRPRVKLDFL
jgi:hypothetical protein